MPKYYVSIPNLDQVILAKDPLDACVKISVINSIMTVGLYWKVSEIGFSDHKDDIYISDVEIIREDRKSTRLNSSH